ncbi:MAG: hypothetical protein ACTHMC_25825 [Pseudobacter sp.]|uniref:hypothetical protein n=1 Tax=Pseudobacter sp. TaxID=2045420 RepID=UPI003F7FE653
MKRSFVVFSALVIAALSFSSCNKNLKDDIKDLQRENSEMKEKLNGIANALGTDEPITVTTSFKDRDNVDRSVKETYSFKSSGTSTQSMVKQPNGKYDIYVERFSDVNWNEYAWVAFTYDPATKAITNKRGGHSWDDYGNYNSNAYFNENDYSTGLTFTVNIKSIDLTTGVISMDVTMSGTAEFSNGYGGNVPNTNSAVTTSFSFDGKLRVYTQVNPA